MSLIKWSPFFFEPFDGSDKLFDEMTTAGRQNIVPPIDMYETSTAVVVETPLAGVDPNKVEIGIDNGILSIKGTMERKTEVDEKNYYRKEVRSGAIFRQIVLPTRVLEDKAQASFENGILKIEIPKAEQPKSIKVEIKKK
ncbi:MAG TPA: Hsp20/alpha crystallin family protein [Patescibacteria group bacterium]|nr:Hsp20/alpha crystallin family protein [Patescibacteria group bacterium]